MYIKADYRLDDFFTDIIKGELNVKELVFAEDVREFTSYTFLSIGVNAAHQVLVNILRHKGDHRRRRLADRHQREMASVPAEYGCENGG